jgi:hypothetical protein
MEDEVLRFEGAAAVERESDEASPPPWRALARGARFRTSLAWPFALVGIIGGLLAGAVFDNPGRAPLSLALCTPVVAGLFGRLLDRVRGGVGLAVALLLGTPLAGFVNALLSYVVAGVLDPSFVTHGRGLLAGIHDVGQAVPLLAIFGALCSAPFLPALIVVAAASRRARTKAARPATLVGNALARGPWVAALAAGVVAGPMLSLIPPNLGLPRALLVPLTSHPFGVLLALALLDGRALLRARRLARRERVALDAGGGPIERGPDFVDLGVGEGDHGRVVEEGPPFRPVRRRIADLRGDLHAATAVLRVTAALDVFALAAATAAVYATLR